MAEAGSGLESWGSFLRFWGRIGALSFGGPAGQVALLHRELVDQKKLLDDAQFLRALNFCMLLPGPEAQQLATWCGWRLKGPAGGLAAGLLFVLPGALVMAALALVYIAAGDLQPVRYALWGVQAVVLAIVGEAIIRLSRRSLKTPVAWAFAAIALLAVEGAHIPFPLLIAVAALGGAWLFPKAKPVAAPMPAPWGKSAATAALWLGIWLTPLAFTALWLGPAHAMTRIGAFFAQVAALSFGGAYAALAWVADAAVSTQGWLTKADMAVGLGLAETTPGPLVLVFQFVAALAGAGVEGPWASPLLGAGIAMALVLWMIFAPSFLWIFTFAPHLEGIAARPGLARAMAGISAAVVGVVASLALLFARHILFDFPPATGIAAALFALIGLWLLVKRHWNVALLVVSGAAAGLVLGYAGVAVPI